MFAESIMRVIGPEENETGKSVAHVGEKGNAYRILVGKPD